MKLIQKIFGSENDRTLKRYRRLVVRINELEPQMEQLQDADFPNKTEEYQKRYKDGEALDDLLPEANLDDVGVPAVLFSVFFL